MVLGGYESISPYSLQRRVKQEKHFLKKGEKFIDLSIIYDPIDRMLAADEIRSAILESLYSNQLLILEAYSEEQINEDEQLAADIFGEVRPEGKLLGLFRLQDKYNVKRYFTVSVFESKKEFVVHRAASDDWDMPNDAAQATAVAIASAVILNPLAQVSVTDARGITEKYEQLITLNCLGFRPDAHTVPYGSFTINPKFVLAGIKQ